MITDIHIIVHADAGRQQATPCIRIHGIPDTVRTKQCAQCRKQNLIRLGYRVGGMKHTGLPTKAAVCQQIGRYPFGIHTENIF